VTGLERWQAGKGLAKAWRRRNPAAVSTVGSLQTLSKGARDVARLKPCLKHAFLTCVDEVIERNIA
jgi:hypothetical protein